MIDNVRHALLSSFISILFYDWNILNIEDSEYYKD